MRVRYISSLTVVLLLLTPVLLCAQSNGKNLHPTPESIYRELSLMPQDARKIAFKELSPQTRDEVWLTHLKNYLQVRGDLTDAERSVIFEAMGLLSNGLASGSEDDPSWPLKAFRPLQALEIRANSVCRRDVVKEAFGVLGPATNQASMREKSERTRPGFGAIAPMGNPVYDCDCNQGHDFCGSPTSPIVCTGLSCRTSDQGCGWFWLQACDGLCF